MKKIWHANFLESLNLIDDELIVYMDNDTNSRSIYNGKNKVGFIIISLLCLGFNLALPVIISYGIQDNLKESPLPTPSINFLPLNISLILFLIWCIVWLFSNRKKNKSIETYIRILMSIIIQSI